MFSVKLQKMAIPKLHLPDLLQVPNDWPDKAVQETATTSEHTTTDVSTEFWPTTYSASPAKQTASPRMRTTPAKIPENSVSSTSLTGDISRTLFPIDAERITMPEKMEEMRSDSLNEPSTSRGILISHEKDYGPTETNDIIRAVNRKKEVQSAGLKIIASVCDQGVTNVKAVRMLIEETRANALRNNLDIEENVISIDGNMIIPLFDPPHLLKCIRNNLLTKDLSFWENDIKKIGKWSHIRDAYLIDLSAKVRNMPKLTDLHVMPSRVLKMKVAMCTQVFSQSVSSTIELMSRSGSESPDKSIKIPAEAQDTADLCFFLNQLFDSMNGEISNDKSGRRAVHKRSRHQLIWRRSIDVLKSMKFIANKPTDKAIPPVIPNFILTLEGFLKIWNLLLIRYKFPNFPTRSFNQDPLENFFGQVRQHGVRNINPTPACFTHYFKSLLIRNFLYPHSRGSNCEADHCVGLLKNIRAFLNQSMDNGYEEEMPFFSDVPSSFTALNPLEEQAINRIFSKLSKEISLGEECGICNQHLYGSSSNFHEILIHIFHLAYFIFSKNFYVPKLLFKTKQRIIKELHLPLYSCGHSLDIKKKLLNISLPLILNMYCQTLNNILCKKIVNINNLDKLQEYASKYVKKVQ
ncbi:hypothetical protein MML48_9g00017621 [Holotrichia oblita]|uniref:Uncharacterized protein n=1 Tax=Holotrichia oblita TaxID=644536 RepID=A0ACB9SMB7_HOLOL|nr:hypothetical protein MML48_9g00017621 [Holotrichia oblita]